MKFRHNEPSDIKNFFYTLNFSILNFCDFINFYVFYPHNILIEVKLRLHTIMYSDNLWVKYKYLHSSEN